MHLGSQVLCLSFSEPRTHEFRYACTLKLRLTHTHTHTHSCQQCSNTAGREATCVPPLAIWCCRKEGKVKIPDSTSLRGAVQTTTLSNRMITKLTTDMAVDPC